MSLSKLQKKNLIDLPDSILEKIIWLQAPSVIDISTDLNSMKNVRSVILSCQRLNHLAHQTKLKFQISHYSVCRNKALSLIRYMDSYDCRWKLATFKFHDSEFRIHCSMFALWEEFLQIKRVWRQKPSTSFEIPLRRSGGVIE